MAAYTMKQIDDAFWKEFKIQCANRGMKMNAVILGLLKTWVKEPKKAKKERRKV